MRCSGQTLSSQSKKVFNCRLCCVDVPPVPIWLYPWVFNRALHYRSEVRFSGFSTWIPHQKTPPEGGLSAWKLGETLTTLSTELNMTGPRTSTEWKLCIRLFITHTLLFLCPLKVVLTVLCVYLNTRCDRAFTCKLSRTAPLLTVLTTALFRRVNWMLSPWIRCRSLHFHPQSRGAPVRFVFAPNLPVGANASVSGLCVSICKPYEELATCQACPVAVSWHQTYNRDRA